MKILAIIGSADLGQLIAYHAINDKHFDKIVFFDDTQTIGTKINNYDVIGKISDVEICYKQNKFNEIIVAVGYNHIKFKKQIFENLVRLNIPIASIIHSSSYIDKSCKIGKGVFILPGCILDRNVVVDDNTLLNTACSIAHDTYIGKHCFLSPRVAIAGFTNVGEMCVLGINCTLIDNLTICSSVKIGGGAVVTESIEDVGLYVGVPAKKIKK